MQAVGKTPGLFRIQLTQYFDATQLGSSGPDSFVRVYVYRKQNPVLMDTITLPIHELATLTFANEACASLRRLNFLEGRYYTTRQFDPERYTDPGGYYIIWDRCCRNDALTNVDGTIPAGVGMVFYLEFPPMTKNGASFSNSSPDFGIPNGDYICINKPFTFNVGATDIDGDQLRYSLVTPLTGYTTKSNPGFDYDMILPKTQASYPTITWAPGYSLTNIIPGTPPLSIDPTTGKLTVKASKEGLYLFTVQCEEFRNGQRIGVVRRDFQLPVVDCAKNTPPPSPITLAGKLLTDTLWCAGKPLVLSVEKNPIWAYQWQKDGLNLRGHTSDTLQVTDSGLYTVVKSQANACANDTTSQSVKVTITKGAPVTLTIASTAPYCTGDTLTLKANGAADYQYSWRKDGQTLTGQTQPSVRANQPGLYTVLVKSPSSACGEGSDTLRVALNPKPSAQIAAPTPTFCSGDSVVFTTTNQSGYKYVWKQNGTKLSDTTTRLIVRQAGVYQVLVTAPTGCTAASMGVTASQYAQPTVRFDSIPTVCNTSNAITLQGQPTGGVYTGPGIQGDQFNPATVGIGRYQLTYTVTSDKGCKAKQNRWAVVSSGIKLAGQTSYSIVKGESVQLLTHTDAPVNRYQWEPPTSLNFSDVASPIARPEATTPYQVTASTGSGCVANLSVLVTVIDPLYIPSAFSPNGDGLNDVWIIQNINLFPQCDVWIYNRWGNLIFHSRGYAQPWDGTDGQAPVEAGVYTYQIRTGSELLTNIYRGALVVVH
jgi:gliding motility-associated-like protein